VVPVPPVVPARLVLLAHRVSRGQPGQMALKGPRAHRVSRGRPGQMAPKEPKEPRAHRVLTALRARLGHKGSRVVRARKGLRVLKALRVLKVPPPRTSSQPPRQRARQ
jgi:hypothetical protein